MTIDNSVDFPSGETTPLISEEDALLAHDHLEGGALRGSTKCGNFGEDFDDVPKERRRLGFWSVVFLTSTRIIGAGIFGTPSLILQQAGSVGMALTMWVAGSMIAITGTAVYLELGTGLPRSGGEKVYLEFIYRHPKYFVSCVIGVAVAMMPAAGAGGVIFAEYILQAFGIEPTLLLTRTVATCTLLFAFVMHACFLEWGIRLQNVLGILGIVNLLFVAFAGLLVAVGVIPLQDGRELPRNFDHMWEGTRWQVNAFSNGMYSIIWSYFGYQNANYVLSEIKDPIRTAKRAMPVALGIITTIYMMVNVAFFAVIDKEEIRAGGQVAAALFFRNVFGAYTERYLDLIIALSVLGSLMSVIFAQGRVMQELGREDIIPFSATFASNLPFDSPAVGLFQMTFFAILSITIPPPGDAFKFVINFVGYPSAVINVFITLGMFIMYAPWNKEKYNWQPPFKAWKAATVVFLLANLFLVIGPLVPPEKGRGPYIRLPYWIHTTGPLIILSLGTVYWWMRFRLLPRWGGYKIVRHYRIGKEGVSRAVFRKVLQ